MNYIEKVLFLILVSSCSSNEQRKQGDDKGFVNESPTMYFEKGNIEAHVKSGYDSLRFYRDANWITFEGKNELSGDRFEYPFLCYLFYQNKIEILVFFNKSKLVHWFFEKRDNVLYTQLEHYDKDARDTIHNYFIYHSGVQLQLSCFSPDIFSDEMISVRSVLKTAFLDSLTIKQHLYLSTYGRKQVALKDILNFDSTKLSDDFSFYSETTLRVQDDRLYQTMFYKREDEEENIDDDEVIKDLDFHYRSFFYYYVNVFRTWKSVR